ncbi:MAG: nuclear transport factor 2 family protein [Acidobacteriota bacterium]|nr:nuclear transport factor 2 family protein [Acidobacteriota bacterium]MDH3784982.1 nuclear transport factor 2 family protein [Acidobacteriota bacterium]
MRHVALSILVAAAFMTGPPISAQSDEDHAGVERAVLDYVEGLYELKPELIKRSVHPDLQKFGFARRSADRLTAEWGVDYFHLAKYDGKRMLVHVLWQSLDD